MNGHLPDDQRLRADLERVFGEAAQPSPELRARVLEHARRSRPGRTPRPRPRWRVPAIAATLTAAALLTVLLTRPDAPIPTSDLVLEKGVDEPARVMARAPLPSVDGDLNGDGQVDILDAWRLAHAPDASGSGENRAHADASGAIASDALDRLMQQIVALRGGAS